MLYMSQPTIENIYSHFIFLLDLGYFIVLYKSYVGILFKVTTTKCNK